MKFTEAIQAGFRNYVNFMGRASRSEFWYWCLFAFLVAVAASNIDKKLFPDLFASGSSPFCSLFGVGFLLPNLSIMVRRLHDIDRSGWWVLIVLIPLFGWILLIYWACQPGTPGTNRFGANALGGGNPLGGAARAGSIPPG